MKELDEVSQLRPDKEIISEIQKEYTLKRRIIKKPGLILFGVDTDTWTASPVKITSDVIYDPYEKRVINQNKAYEVPGKFIVYEFAINAQRAVDNVMRDLVEFIRKHEEKKINPSKVELPPLERIEMRLYKLGKQSPKAQIQGAVKTIAERI